MIAPLLLAVTQASLDAPFAAPAFDGSLVALCVRDLDGKVLFERNSALRVMPASNQKLLTCAFALRSLGPDYRPKTNLWKTSTRTVVESEGDPLMTYARLKEAVTKLKLDHRLPVYVKQSYRPYWPDSWEVDDLGNKYAAPISAFTVDRGSFELWATNGRPRFEPEPFGTRLRYRPSAGPVAISYDPWKREVTLLGSLPKERKRLDTLSLPRPDEAAASVLGSFFVPTTTVPNSVPTAILEGNTIADTVAACLPPSDNNIAENLLLMSAQRFEPLGERPYEVARKQMKAFLTGNVGLPEGDINVFDGSGMSRHDLVTARSVSQLLVWANNQPTAAVWRNSLARSSAAGTLQERLKDVTFLGKTGSLDMVAALSGYVRTKSGGEVVVSVILNHYSGSAKDARNAADEFVRKVAEAY